MRNTFIAIQTIILITLSYIVYTQKDIIEKKDEKPALINICHDFIITYKGEQSLKTFISFFARKGVPLTLEKLLEGGEDLDYAINYLKSIAKTTNIEKCKKYYPIAIHTSTGFWRHEFGINGWKFDASIDFYEPLTLEKINVKMGN